MDINAIQKIYGRYAHLYDLYFGAIFSPGRRAVVERMNIQPGDRVLEVGVGTGLSLPLYPTDAHVVGIDVCREMLERARERADRAGLPQVKALEVMDAEAMRFADASFDKVVAMYVASVVPSPARLIDEMRRVCKPDGELFIVNHFHHTNPIVGGIERLIAPLSRLFGWHPDFSMERFIAETGLEVTEQAQVNLFGYWTLLRASPRRRGAAAAIPPTRDAKQPESAA